MMVIDKTIKTNFGQQRGNNTSFKGFESFLIPDGHRNLRIWFRNLYFIGDKTTPSQLLVLIKSNP